MNGSFLTPRELASIQIVAACGPLIANQIRRACYPTVHSKDGRVVRAGLQKLVEHKLLNRTWMEVCNPLSAMRNCPAYFNTRAGLELLAAFHKDESYLLKPTRTPQWQFLGHSVACSEFQLLAREAIACQSHVQMPCFLREHDIANQNETEPAKRYKLYTLIQQFPKRTVCASDCAFELAVDGHHRGFYCEIETGSNPPRKKAAECTPGYVGMLKEKLQKKHFPEAEDFRVLVTAVDERHRDALLKAFKATEAAELIRIASNTELNADTFLFGKIWHRCDGGVSSLVLPPENGLVKSEKSPLPGGSR